jgi:hypothetical protein
MRAYKAIEVDEKGRRNKNGYFRLLPSGSIYSVDEKTGVWRRFNHPLNKHERRVIL